MKNLNETLHHEIYPHKGVRNDKQPHDDFHRSIDKPSWKPRAVAEKARCLAKELQENARQVKGSSSYQNHRRYAPKESLDIAGEVGVPGQGVQTSVYQGQ